MTRIEPLVGTLVFRYQPLRNHHGESLSETVNQLGNDRGAQQLRAELLRRPAAVG